MYLFIKKHRVGIVIAIVIIALLFLGNIDAIKAIVDGWNPSIVLAVLSVFIAGCVLGVTIWQGLQNYRHNKLTVKPLLRFETTHKKVNNLFHYKFKLINNGVGPAIIKTFVLISADGKNFYDNFDDYNNFLLKMMENFQEPDKTYLGRGSVMAKGETCILWEFKYDPNSQSIKEMEKLCLNVEYQSIYEDEIIPLGFGFDNEIDDKEPA